MARYRNRPDGMYDVDTSAGTLPIMTDPYELGEAGYTLDDTKISDLGLPDARVAGPGGLSFDAYDAKAPPPAPPPAAPPPAQGLPGEHGQVPADVLHGALAGEAGPPPPPPSNAHEAPRSGLSFEEYNSAGRGGGGKGKGDPYAPRTERMTVRERPADEDKPRTVTTPAHDDKTTWQVTEGAPEDPELDQAEGDLDFNRRFNVIEEGRVKGEKAKKAAAAEDATLALMERQVNADEIKAANLRKMVDERQAVIDKERDEVDKMKVDPDRYVSNMGTWAKIVTAISLIAGGARAGLQHRDNNAALDALNAAIDKDIRNQKDEIASRKGGIAERENALERLTKFYGNPEIAEKELRERQLSLAGAYAKQATRDSPEDVQANVDAALADIDAQKIDRRRAINELYRDHVVSNYKRTPAQTVVVGGGPRLSKEDETDLKSLGDDYEKAGVFKAEDNLAKSEDLLAQLPEGMNEIPTYDTRNKLSQWGRDIGDWAGGAGTGSKLLGDTEQERQVAGTFSRAKAEARNAMFGSSLSDNEKADFARRYESANSVSEIRAINAEARRSIARLRAGISAGYRDVVVNEHARRQQARAPKARPGSTRSDR